MKARLNLLPNVLFFTQMGIIFIARLPQYEGTHFIYLQFLLAIFTLLYIVNKVGNLDVFKRFRVIYFIYSLCFIFNFITTHNAVLQEVLYAVLLMPVIALLLFFFRISSTFSLVQFLSVTGYIMYQVLSGTNTIDEVTYNSGNFLSYYALFYSFPYYVNCYREKKEPQLLVVVIVFFVSLMAMGRGGIIASGFFLLFQLYFKIRGPGYSKYFYRLLILVISIAVLKYGIFFTFLDAAFTKFNEYGMDTRGRSLSYQLYLESLINPINLFIGTDIKDIPYIYKYLDGNIHTSWLTVHSRVGFYMFFVFAFVISGLKKIYKEKNYNVLTVLLSLLLGGITNADIGGVMVGGDMYIFYLIMMYVESQSHIKLSNNKIVEIGYNESKNTSTVSTTVSPYPGK